MKPRSVIAFLRSVANDIDQAEAPSQSLIASRIFGLVASIESGGTIDADFAAKFDRSFKLLDLQSGDMNMVLTYDLKKAMPEFASEFDKQLLAMRDAGLVELEAYNRKDHGTIPPSYLRAGIDTPEGKLIWVSQVKHAPVEEPAPSAVNDGEIDRYLGDVDKAYTR